MPRERVPYPEPLLRPYPGHKLCPECDGRRCCTACDGQGWWDADDRRPHPERCRMCSGTRECFYCGGPGQVLARRPHPWSLIGPQPGWTLCLECEGTRYCQACDGQGRTEDGQECRICKGSELCSYCHGQGQVDRAPCGGEAPMSDPSVKGSSKRRWRRTRIRVE
jgi:hypothetical protein